MASTGSYAAEVFVDRGGTFTDCVGYLPSGEVRVAKVLSSDEAPIAGIRELLGLAPDETPPPCDVRLGTTLTTNALLERRGVPTVLVASEGLEDVLVLGDQRRPTLFDPTAGRAAPLPARTLSCPVRQLADGTLRGSLDRAAFLAQLRQVRAEGFSSIAISLTHAHRFPALEQTVGELAAEAGFAHVSLSHEVAREQGYLARTSTTVVDAYLTPLLRDYLDHLVSRLPGSRLRLMQSSGVLIGPQGFRGHNSILSGPAGGVVGAADVALTCGAMRAIGFDMGGTSTDVSQFQGRFERVQAQHVAGLEIRTPALAVHTVAAGGGSICRIVSGRPTVGPESAGAHPGPLCYGDPAAEALTLSDVNLLLGRLDGAQFPFPLHRDRAEAKLRALSASAGLASMALAEAFFVVAIDHMVGAIRRITVERGHDVTEYALVVFGGAGGQHACALARALGVRELLCHPLGGVLSAHGIGVSKIGHHAVADLGSVPLSSQAIEAAETVFKALTSEGRERLVAEGLSESLHAHERTVDLHYAGSETVINLHLQDAAQLEQSFHEHHAVAYGYARVGHPILVRAARVASTGGGRLGPTAHLPMTTIRERHGAEPLPVSGRARLFLDGAYHEVPIVHRDALAPGGRWAGPCVVVEPTGTLVVEPGFVMEMRSDGILRLRALGEQALNHGPSIVSSRERGGPDPLRLELMANAFMAMAEEMGVILQRTALSTNIRERLDFSCAVFDESGALVANAPHIPVHLGAMAESVRAVRSLRPEMAHGDAFAINDPAHGGSHLPDITLVTPVFVDGARRFFVASRGHHADVGGLTPGSMPPEAKCLRDEGVVLRAVQVVREGAFDEAVVRAALSEGPYPARRPDENLGDLKAQLAANVRGVALLHALCEQYSADEVAEYMGHVQANAAEQVRRMIEAFPDGTRRFEDAMDDGTPVVVTTRIAGDRLTLDFTGTGPAQPSNLNAPRAVTVAAVLYVLRTLVGTEIPLNQGCLSPVALILPEGCLLSPPPDAAVSAGNVETSQRVVDVLLGAFEFAAASQGTMNNVTFGGVGPDGNAFSHYETIAGGAGATAKADGPSGIHCHMTNSRITDVEVLESRFPVHLVRFGLRRDSGGAGVRKGGAGVIREYEFLSEVEVAVLSERRARPPFGLRGGEPGDTGHNYLSGRPMPGHFTARLLPSTRLRIETPAGGGFGPVGRVNDEASKDAP